MCQKKIFAHGLLSDIHWSLFKKFLTCHFVFLLIFAAGSGGACPLHLCGVLDGPGRHVELVGEDGEQREDVLVEERLLLLLLLRRRRGSGGGRRTQGAAR